MKLTFLLFLHLFVGSISWAQIIMSIAGNGAQGFSGDGPLARNTSLYYPSSVAFDAAGNYYIADSWNNRIRMVSASTGEISTVAGNGSGGFAGDGSAATAAQLYVPTGITLDPAGNIYIADTYNNRIRKVTAATGLISTIAGNGNAGFSGDSIVATDAELNGPTSVAVDGSGNVYIGDVGNNRVREITMVNGFIHTVAGNGSVGFSGDGAAAVSAQLNGPYGVTLDVSGNVYIADGFNNCIRKVTVSSGLIATVAGKDSAGYSGDNGLATQAKLYNPVGVTVDGSGNIYIADLNNNRIRKVRGFDGIISTIAGNGVQGFSGDSAAATAAELSKPCCIVLDASGNGYVADTYNNRIRMISGPLAGIVEVAKNQGVTIYPNPASNQVAIETRSTEEQLLQVFDGRGCLVQKMLLTNGMISMDVDGLPDGLYTLCITGHTGIVSRRLLISK